MNPFFQCKKLDSWENVRLLIAQNATVGNQTYPDYLKVRMSGFLFFSMNKSSQPRLPSAPTLGRRHR